MSTIETRDSTWLFVMDGGYWQSGYAHAPMAAFLR